MQAALRVYLSSADKNDLAVAYGNGLGPGAILIHCVDSSSTKTVSAPGDSGPLQAEKAVIRRADKMILR